MLGIFRGAFAHLPPELQIPAEASSSGASRAEKTPNDILLRAFRASHRGAGCFSTSFSRGAAAMAYVPAADPHVPGARRLFCAAGGVYCLFHGTLRNLGALARQYGMPEGGGGGKRCNEAALVIEAYRALSRDRGPRDPEAADRAVRDLEGPFAFAVYDSTTGAVFAALSSDGAIPLYWGMAGEDGSVVISDEVGVVKAGCGRSFAPFPPGCMFHSEGGLRSFEQQSTNKMRAVPRVDSEGALCDAAFGIDPCIPPRVPRVGSAADCTGV